MPVLARQTLEAAMAEKRDQVGIRSMADQKMASTATLLIFGRQSLSAGIGTETSAHMPVSGPSYYFRTLTKYSG